MATMILTGAASGIGKAMARALHARGHTLVLADLNESGLRATAEEHRLTGATLETLDVRNADAWEALVKRTVEKHGALDVLMNIAGVLVPKWAKDASAKDVDLTIDVNVKGMIHGTNTAIRAMIPRGSGHVVNIASIAGLVPVPGIAIYSASKHAARAYSIAVGQEVRKHGVYVTAVCPTVVATPMMDIQLDREEAAYTFSGGTPLTAEQVAEAVILRGLTKKPLELVLPSPGTRQGDFAKFANAFPEIGLAVTKRVAKLGRAAQKKIRAT
ncbi:MAG TPA: SDR family oxidoreductase [Polyangiaceae bacterium]|nr:SDR family oxidoreductase [Polyangiaceae bacterium]